MKELVITKEMAIQDCQDLADTFQEQIDSLPREREDDLGRTPWQCVKEWRSGIRQQEKRICWLRHLPAGVVYRRNKGWGIPRKGE